MSARGKPNIRKIVKPNIAAATRVKPEKTENDSTNGDMKIPNRGRGKGTKGTRGNTRGMKPQLMQTEGTFTAGLSEAPVKANRQVDYGTEEITGKLEKSIHSMIKPKVERNEAKSDGVTEIMEEGETYQNEWLSDTELDEIELHELIQPSIISDIKKGREVPIVLPQKDMNQFQGLVRGMQISSIDEELRTNVNTGSKASHPAALVQKYINDKANDLMLLQMPASLDVVHQVFAETRTAEKMEVDEKKPQPSSSSQSTFGQQKHCMDGLPTGAEIGKLQLLKNGKVRLVIGNRVMDMHEAIPSKMFETIVQTQTFVAPKNEAGSSTQAQTNQGNTGSMTVLGNVGDSFLCTYNVAWDG